ncbi:endonuclease/exonuclease/phosphatase family protein [bacterium]|nr:endonuclease/exonuclease/phosphatase family protein [bacterium]
MNKSLFLMIKIFIVLVFSVFVLNLSGCEETYENTENTDAVDPTEPAEATEPTESTDPTEPTEPSEPTDPTEPTDPAEPAEPTEPAEPAEPEDPCLAPDAEKINSVIVGTYNTHLFFDKMCDSGYCSGSDFESVPSDSEYNTKVKDLSDSVKKIGADIILLQEVEKDSCLKDLFEKSGGYDEYYLGEKGYDASVDTGVMTKGKITYKNKHTEQIDCAECDGGKTTFTRAFLETHIELGCRKIIVFSAHFRSKNDDDPARRLAEAAAAANILKNTAKKYPGALIVMGGDLNDEPGSGTLEYFENDSAFLRVADELPSKDQATYLYRGDAIALDHIFLVKGDAGSYQTGSAEVVKDAPSLYSLGSSDHAALRAVFEF